MPDINDVIHEDLVISPSTAEQIPVNVTQSKTGNVITVTTYDKDGAPTSKTLTEPTLTVGKTGNVVTLTATDANGMTEKNVYEPTIAVTKHGTEDPVPAREGDFDVKIKVANGSGNGFIEQTVTIPNPNAELSDRAHVDSVSRVKTRTGNPIMITDAAAEIADKLQIRLEPAQDLHGYGKPWVGGAGKNLLDISTVSGGGTTVTQITNGIKVARTAASYGATRAPDIETIGLVNGTTYTISGHIKVISGKGKVAVRKTSGHTVIVASDLVSSGEQDFSFQYTCDTSESAYISFFTSWDSSQSGEVEYTNIQVEAGSTATAWEPYENICPITGYDAVNVEDGGKNIIDGWLDKLGPDGAVKIYTASAYCSAYAKVVKGATYTVSRIDASQVVLGFTTAFPENNTPLVQERTVVNSIHELTFVSPTNGYVVIRDNLDKHTMQIEFGNQITAYEEPKGAEVYPITLSTASRTVSGTTTTAGTVYGGTLTLNRDGSGQVVVDRKILVLDGSSDETWSYSDGKTYISGMFGSEVDQTVKGISNMFMWKDSIKSTVGNLALGEIAYGNTASNYQINMYPSASITSAESFKTFLASNNLQVCMKLASPVIYTLTANQVQTLLGYNYIYADAGIITLDYRQEKYTEESTVLGLLPTGTATGNPITISDGAKDMPLKKLQITINPKQDLSNGNPSPTNICPISGWDEVKAGRAGKNLFDKSTFTGSSYIDASGARVSTSGSTFGTTDYIPVEPGWKITRSGAPDAGTSPCYAFYDKYKNFISGGRLVQETTTTLTVPANAYYHRTTVATATVDTCQIEVGSTATAYEPYNGQEETINLPTTVYGGSLILDEHGEGTLTVDRGMIDISKIDWTYNSSSQYFYIAENTAKKGTVGQIPDLLISDRYQAIDPSTAASDVQRSMDGVISIGVSNPLIMVRNYSCTSATDLKNNGGTIVYPLATPITYTLTANQIRTLLGANTIWADCGAVSIEYGRDIASADDDLNYKILENGMIEVNLGTLRSSRSAIFAELGGDVRWGYFKPIFAEISNPGAILGDLIISTSTSYNSNLMMYDDSFTAQATFKNSTANTSVKVTLAKVHRMEDRSSDMMNPTVVLEPTSQSTTFHCTDLVTIYADPVITGSISMGRKSNTTTGSGSTAVGNNVTASGSYSHAEGNNVTASGSYSHAEGDTTTASSYSSHAEGYGTTASGSYSHAEGCNTTASGDDSHAEGYNTTATGSDSHAEGIGTQAVRVAQHVFGKYNALDSTGAGTTSLGKYVEIVGGGDQDMYGQISRANIRTLDWYGNEWLAGSLKIGNTELTEAKLQALLALVN